jgi:hypothetical protein
MNYFKTSAADTLRAQNWQNDINGRKGVYAFCLKSNNCTGLTLAGLVIGGAIGKTTAGLLSEDPNILFWELSYFANQNYFPPEWQEVVTHWLVDPADCEHCD